MGVGCAVVVPWNGMESKEFACMSQWNWSRNTAQNQSNVLTLCLVTNDQHHLQPNQIDDQWKWK